MNIIDTTLFNHSLWPILADILQDFPHDYSVDHNGIIRRTVAPICSECNITMNKNGYNTYTKSNLGSVKIGRWKCPMCPCSLEEDHSFWVRLIDEAMQSLAYMACLLRKHNVSYHGASEILSLIFNRSKETVRLMFNKAIGNIDIPACEPPLIIHYDEQHPKQGRSQKYRLTLLNGENGNVIADELFDDKTPNTIMAFLKTHLAKDKPAFIVTDLYSSYPKIFEEFFTGEYHHQLCLLHLNKLICKDFRNLKKLDELRLRYEFLNIFYDRSKELKFLDNLLSKERKKKGRKGYKNWYKNAKKKFFDYIYKLEKRRRRRKENLKIRPYKGAIQMFNRLVEKFYELPEVAQKRLRMISERWENLTAFYGFDNAPATNNVIENYYSASLKTDRKKQFRSDVGISNQLKLSRISRAGELTYNGPSIIDIFRKFTPFQKPG